MGAGFVEIKALPKDSEEEGQEIYLHYIGRRYYTMETFIEEAKKFGVSRAVPLHQLKKLHWGDKIYTAFYQKDDKGPYALVFGYFPVLGLNITNSEVKERMKQDKRYREVRHEVVSGGGARVTRGCGSYSIGSVSYVDNDVSELAEIIEDASKELGVKTKVMAASPYFYTVGPFKVRGVPFSRGLLRVKLPKDAPLLGAEPVKKEPLQVAYLRNYRLGRPSKKRKKKVREALEALPLDRWLSDDQPS